jgi:hypothetical protein
MKNNGIGKMRFDVENVKEMLVGCGFVFSVRSYCLEDCDVFVDDVGVCRRSLIGEVRKIRDLEEVCEFSGFENVKEWLKMILRMYKGRSKYLYLVEKVEGSARRRELIGNLTWRRC